MPDPLHPAVVHLPMAIALLLPLFAIAGTIAIARGALPVRAWSAVTLLGGVLVLSSWAALETGEDQEDLVEDVVSHDVIHEHEEAAELFMVIAGLTFIATGAGLLGDKKGQIGRVASIVLSLGLIGAATNVGHLGGELVYVHGAANAYIDGAGDGAAEGAGHGAEQSHDH